MNRRGYSFARIGAATALLAAMLVSSACSSTPRGGAESLPGDVPAGISFTAAEESVSAPKVSGTLVDGTPVSFEDLWQERPLVVQFATSWCTQCQAGESEWTALVEEFDEAVAVLHVMRDKDAQDVARYLDDYEVTGPAVIDRDGSLWRRYAVSEPPVTVLIDTSGGIVRMWPGGASADDVREELSLLVHGRQATGK